MAGNGETTTEAQVEQAAADPWALAFAALDKEDEAPAEAAPDTDGRDGADVSDTDTTDASQGAAETQGGDGPVTEEVAGGPGDTGGVDVPTDEGLDWDDLDISEDGITEYRESLMEDIRERTLTDVANAYIKQGARNTNGRLGATINDPDVCKRDRDGVPRFYNPETGREFTGDNPRRQAQEWVDDYNRELSEAFNKTCQQYERQLMEREGGRLAIIEFAPKYKALDPVRRSMLESIIEDYEVTDDDGNIVAYSCDLDKALAAVNRQVRVIQQRFSKQGAAAPAKPSGPALDTPSVGSTGGGGDGKPQFKSIAEAMEWEQDRLLERMKGSKR